MIDLPAKAAPPPAAIRRWRISRKSLLGGLYLVATLNGIAAEAARSIGRLGLAEAGSSLFGIDAVVMVACAIGLSLIRQGQDGDASAGDVFAALAVAAVILLPHRSAGWVAAGLLGGYGLVRHGRARHRDTSLAAASAVFLAVSIHEVWGPALLAVLTPTLARADAALASVTLGLIQDGVGRNGNVVVTGSGYNLVIVGACLASKSILQGLLCCFAFTRLLRPAWRWSELARWGVLAICIVILNTARLTLSGLDLSLYQTLHNGIGSTLFGLVVLSTALCAAALGVRHDAGNRPADR